MTKAQQQVVEMLQDIPDDKVVHILEIIRRLMLLYNTNKEDMVITEIDFQTIFNEITLASETALAKDWLLPEEDIAWADL